jgi:hypothetical protein
MTAKNVQRDTEPWLEARISRGEEAAFGSRRDHPVGVFDTPARAVVSIKRGDRDGQRRNADAHEIGYE